MAQSQVTAVKINLQRLNVIRHAGTGGGITYVADSRIALQISNAILENIGNEAHALFNFHTLAVSNNNTGTFLATMLQRIQAPIGVECYILIMAEDTKDAALLMQLVFAKILLLENLLHNFSP